MKWAQKWPVDGIGGNNMWARIVEFMLACWLAISPFIFGYPSGISFFWINDLICSSLIIFFSLICYYKPLRKMHLFNLLIAFYLIIVSYALKSSPFYQPLQNYIVLGILLLMLALVPSEASKPPMPWRDFYS